MDYDLNDMIMNWYNNIATREQHGLNSALGCYLTFANPTADILQRIAKEFAYCFSGDSYKNIKYIHNKENIQQIQEAYNRQLQIRLIELWIK